MKIKEEINNEDETKFIFNAGNIITRNDVKFEEDARACFDYFLDQKIIQSPVKKLEISMVYEFEIEDHAAKYDDYFLNKIQFLFYFIWFQIITKPLRINYCNFMT